jgi:hypothetical protein
LRARTSKDKPKLGGFFSSSLSSGMIHLKNRSCVLGMTRRLSTREVSHHPGTAGRFKKRIVSI